MSFLQSDQSRRNGVLINDQPEKHIIKSDRSGNNSRIAIDSTFQILHTVELFIYGDEHPVPNEDNSRSAMLPKLTKILYEARVLLVSRIPIRFVLSGDSKRDILQVSLDLVHL